MQYRNGTILGSVRTDDDGMLVKHESMWTVSNNTKQEPFQWRYLGPGGREALVNQHGRRRTWQILLMENGAPKETWFGNYPAQEEAESVVEEFFSTGN